MQMTQEEYYTAPDQEIFDDIKKCAIEVWQTMDNTYGYVDEKVDRIKDIENIKDNAWYMVAMFDQDNQRKLYALAKPETRLLLDKLI